MNDTWIYILAATTTICPYYYQITYNMQKLIDLKAETQSPPHALIVFDVGWSKSPVNAYSIATYESVVVIVFGSWSFFEYLICMHFRQPPHVYRWTFCLSFVGIAVVRSRRSASIFTDMSRSGSRWTLATQWQGARLPQRRCRFA